MTMQKTYPALFHYNKSGGYTITFPDLEGCISEGYDLDDAMYMAREGLRCWLEYMADEGERVSPPSDSKNIKCGKKDIVTLVSADVKEKVTRRLQVPRKLNYLAQRQKLDLSKFLSEALERHFGEKVA